MARKIKRQRLLFPYGAHLSSKARDFLRLLLTKDPDYRPSAAKCLEHPFLAIAPAESEELGKTDGAPEPEMIKPTDAKKGELVGKQVGRKQDDFKNTCTKEQETETAGATADETTLHAGRAAERDDGNHSKNSKSKCKRKRIRRAKPFTCLNEEDE